jgi:hypothetical protein
LDKLRKDKKFVKTFGDIRGDKNKIIPKEFKSVGETFDTIYNKQFYWFTDMEPEEALSNDFMGTVVDIYKTNKELMNYFEEAMR